MDHFLTDNATGAPRQDALNFSDFYPAICEMVNTALTPLTIGIFGAWGMADRIQSAALRSRSWNCPGDGYDLYGGRVCLTRFRLPEAG